MPRRTVLITGGTRGIGLAVARRLAGEGCQLALTWRSDVSAARRFQDEFAANGTPVLMVQADMTEPAQIAAVPRQVAAHFGGLDAVVSNAGITDDAAFATMEPDRVHKVLATNLYGAMHLMRAAVPILRDSAWEPAVVFVSSLGGVVGKEGQVAYAASKGGLIGLTQWLGSACREAGIRFNAVAPGFIRTDMTDRLSPSMTDHIVKGSALGRAGEAHEVADAVAFLLRHGYVQSTTLRLDGGFNR